MLEQVKALLQAQGLELVVIVDDAFDPTPHVEDLEPVEWNQFFDDWSEDDEARLAQALGRDNFDDADPSELKQDAGFLAAAWNLRGESAAAAELFREYELDQQGKREVLRPLQKLLEEELGLTCRTAGRAPTEDISQAQLLFLDLFMGRVEDDQAVREAMTRLRGVVESRRDNPPIVVLLSHSPRLAELGPLVRDDGQLLGCQFRMMSKVSLRDPTNTMEQIHDLVTSRPDSLTLNGFINAWDAAIDTAKNSFLRSVRTLDLSDYANTHALSLEGEGEPLGDYVLDLFDLHLHGVLEGNRDLVRAAKRLNDVAWDTYPPAQFMPSDQALTMMDAAIFHNQRRTEVEVEAAPTEVRLGDVLMAPLAQEQVAAGADRDVYMVLSQACDLQHGNTDRILLLKGRTKSYRAPASKLSGLRTPIMRDQAEVYVVDWDVLGAETWLLADVPQKIKAGFRLVRRFRTPYALQIQQRFAGNLTRVGTMAAMPGRYAVGVKIYLRQKDETAKLLAQASADQEGAVCLIGRDENGAKAWLLLSEQVRNDFAESLKAIPIGDLPPGAPKVADVRSDPEFYRLMKRGLSYKREARSTKPLEGTPFDVVQVFATPSAVVDGKIDRGMRSIIVETEWD
ncbi:hypothetical protein [Ancylobacter mangrovi]|uniref:hypothetical protein n=1 Tax=Ancylobacter mangrovi TaxID=2972472 RepID=UPI002161FBE1|nr:hypothetical protein [Ancylobacter mangrovi]MCS0505132.1 hypothetical protein [Ancylobacter mangrovi]